MRRPYVDACLFIYWVERAGPVAEAAVRWLENQAGAAMCVSPLVRLEVLVKPMRVGNQAVVQSYEALLAKQEWLSMNDNIFARALGLRAKHGLKTPDALHLATALHHGCTEFWTNDGRLKNAAGALAVNVLEATA
jgi:predicted nucleic acid-binding protein